MEFAQGPGRMLSGLGLGGFPGRGAPLKSSSADWLVCSGHASLLLIDGSLPAGSTSAAPAIALWIRPSRENPGRSSGPSAPRSCSRHHRGEGGSLFRPSLPKAKH